MEDEEYWLTSRPRSTEKRGYAVEIYRSKNGENYNLVTWFPKEELNGMTKARILSIENQQLLRDPSTHRYHLYLSLDISREPVEGKWETFLLTSDDPSGPWRPEGFVIRGSEEYDSVESRDPTIDIIDGQYFCLYKARKARTSIVKTVLATSRDGKNWVKLGVPKIDNEHQPNYFLLSGSIIPGSTGLLFVGTKTIDIIKGASVTKHFVVYRIDFRNLNLETLFTTSWTPLSRFEHFEYPIHTYAQVIFDQIRGDRWLIWIEAIDPDYTKEIGLNSEVDRVLLYTSEVENKEGIWKQT